MFTRLARFDVRFRWLVVAVWIVGLVAGSRALPSLSTVTKNSNAQFLSSSASSVRAAKLAALIRDARGSLLGARSHGSGDLTPGEDPRSGRRLPGDARAASVSRPNAL